VHAQNITREMESRCGGRSAYSRPGGAELKCYVKDATGAEIEAYRNQH
jgi:hypothetical protein